MIKRRFQVFISSTLEDLREERKEVVQAILENDCFPASMELFPASNKKQWDIIKKVMDESDFYIVIIAGKYGTIGEDEEGNEISYTEMEFNYALKKEMPIIAFIHNDLDNLTRNKCELSKIKNSKLVKFRKKAMDGRMVNFWKNKGELHAAAGYAIYKLIHDEDNKMPGWVSGEILPKVDGYASMSPEELIDKLDYYKTKNDELNIRFNELVNEIVANKSYTDSLQQFILECYKNPSRLNNTDMKTQIEDIIRKEEEEEWQMEYEQGRASVAQDLN